MSDATVLEIMAAVAEQLETQLASVDGLQVGSMAIRDPTPPTLDVYPGDPFGEATTFQNGAELLFTIRARVSGGDKDASQELLLALMDRNGTSVIGAVRADATFDGAVDDALVEGPSGYLTYGAAGGGGSYLGCEWRLRVLL